MVKSSTQDEPFNNKLRMVLQCSCTRRSVQSYFYPFWSCPTSEGLYIVKEVSVSISDYPNRLVFSFGLAVLPLLETQTRVFVCLVFFSLALLHGAAGPNSHMLYFTLFCGLECVGHSFGTVAHFYF
jgi:hypothetical protein